MSSDYLVKSTFLKPDILYAEFMNEPYHHFVEIKKYTIYQLFEACVKPNNNESVEFRSKTIEHFSAQLHPKNQYSLLKFILTKLEKTQESNEESKKIIQHRLRELETKFDLSAEKVNTERFDFDLEKASISTILTSMVGIAILSITFGSLIKEIPYNADLICTPGNYLSESQKQDQISSFIEFVKDGFTSPSDKIDFTGENSFTSAMDVLTRYHQQSPITGFDEIKKNYIDTFISKAETGCRYSMKTLRDLHRKNPIANFDVIEKKYLNMLNQKAIEGDSTSKFHVIMERRFRSENYANSLKEIKKKAEKDYQLSMKNLERCHMYYTIPIIDQNIDQIREKYRINEQKKKV
jgi:hypothetical protein